jgi:hypothetical protein
MELRERLWEERRGFAWSILRDEMASKRKKSGSTRRIYGDRWCKTGVVTPTFPWVHHSKFGSPHAPPCTAMTRLQGDPWQEAAFARKWPSENPRLENQSRVCCIWWALVGPHIGNQSCPKI